MNNEVRNTLLTLIRKNPEEVTLSERETLGAYVEGMTGIHNAYCLTTDDLQTLAGYVLVKTNH